MFRGFLARSVLVAGLWILSAPLLVACAKPNVNVSVHGVNYSGETFSYYIEDPANPDSSGAGEELEPFAAGGTTCCFSLPKKWRPGIKVQVHSTHWLPKRPDGSLPSVKNVYLVDVPKYVDGKPGELWVVRATDGSVSVISSDFQPDHPKWPGKVKGWPVPSLEYRREQWELMRDHEQEGVELYLSLLDQLEKTPARTAKDFWDQGKMYNPSLIRGFSGPEDQRYLDSLREHFKEGLGRSKKLLEKVMEERP